MVRVEGNKIVGVRIKNGNDSNDVFNGIKDPKTARYLEFKTVDELDAFIKKLNSYRNWFKAENNEETN